MTENTTHNDTITTVIPEAVKELTYIRNPNPDQRSHVVVKGPTWSVTFQEYTDKVLTRIHEIAAAMEAVK